MKNTDEVAVFWDYENCPAPTNASGYTIVNNIRSIAQTLGSVKSFKAYLEVTEQVPVSRALVLRSELQSSGVSLIDCPHNGRKDVADKMILVDMLAHAIDNPAPSTVILISGDRDFAYALSILRLRRYRVVLITLSSAHPSLRAQASLCFDWVSDVLELVDPTWSHQPIFPRHGKASSPPTHNNLYSDSKGYIPSRFFCQESHNEKCASGVEFQDETRFKNNSRTATKHDVRHDLLPSDLPHSKGQPAASVISGTSHNGLEPTARVICSPVVSSCPTYLNGGTETPSIMMALDSNCPQTKVTPNPSDESTAKLATYESIIPSSLSSRSTPPATTSLPHPMQHEAARVTEPVSFDSAVRILATECYVRRPSVSSQRGPYSSTNAKLQCLSSVDQIDSGSVPPVHLDIFPPQNITTPGPPSAPSFMRSPYLTTKPALAQSSVKAANPFQPTPYTVPDEFKILVQCLKSHRLKGRFRPLRSKIALEISHNGATYRQAGVLRFSEYVLMAEKAGIIELGGTGGTAWVFLRPPWYDVPQP